MHVLEPLHETYGIDISDKAIRAAIRDHNEISRVMTEIGDLRKAANPVITGYEFHVLQLVSQVCPHKRILPYLKQTLTELKRRKPDTQPWFRVRLVVTGSEIDDPAFTKLIEDCGAMVVADRDCYGSLPGREQIEILDGETPLRAVARHYLRTSQCPRFMERARSDGRRTYIRDLCREDSADGVLDEQMKFCEFWSYERVLGVHILQEELEHPTVGIEKEYNSPAPVSCARAFRRLWRVSRSSTFREGTGARRTRRSKAPGIVFCPAAILQSTASGAV